MTLYLAWLIILVVTLSLFIGSTEALGSLHQEHHYWYGAWIFALGLLLLGVDAFPRLGALFFAWSGQALMLDDSLQHTVQIFRPSFRSPLHLLYRYLIYNPTHKQR